MKLMMMLYFPDSRLSGKYNVCPFHLRMITIMIMIMMIYSNLTQTQDITQMNDNAHTHTRTCME